MKKIKQLYNIFKITFILVGTILGAGFASGKELVTFFAKFSNFGIFGLFTSCVLFFLFFLSNLFIVHSFKFKNYNEFIEHLFGKKLGNIISYINLVFLFSIFFIMIAGGGSIFTEIYPKLDKKAANFIFCLIIFISLSFGTNGIVKINEIISPILIISLIIFNIYLNFFETNTVFSPIDVTYSAVLYSSYNIITTISLIFNIRNLILNKKTCFYTSILSSCIIFTIGLFIILPLTKNYSYIYNLDLPIVFLIEQKIYNLKYIYTIILFLAIFTTAVGNGFSLIEFLNEKMPKYSGILRAFMCLIALVFSFFGFSTLIEKIYPFFGYIGAFQLVVIILNGFYDFKKSI